MNELMIFNNPEFGEIRTVEVNGEPWFVGKDVATALGYGEGKSLANAVANHVDEEDKGVTELMTPGGNQKMVIINESGLYSPGTLQQTSWGKEVQAVDYFRGDPQHPKARGLPNPGDFGGGNSQSRHDDPSVHGAQRGAGQAEGAGGSKRYPGSRQPDHAAQSRIILMSW